MYIHIGNRIIISDKKVVGIFNAETLMMSDINTFYTKDINKESKTIVILKDNKVLSGNVSSFTIIKRTNIEDIIWRRNNEQ